MEVCRERLKSIMFRSEGTGETAKLPTLAPPFKGEMPVIYLLTKMVADNSSQICGSLWLVHWEAGCGPMTCLGRQNMLGVAVGAFSA